MFFFVQGTVSSLLDNSSNTIIAAECGFVLTDDDDDGDGAEGSLIVVLSDNSMFRMDIVTSSDGHLNFSGDMVSV
jgi:hypothetical protein